MTEEDTFRALQKTPVNVMMGYYEEWATKNGDWEKLIALCQRNGWTWEEFNVVGAVWRNEQNRSRYSNGIPIL